MIPWEREIYLHMLIDHLEEIPMSNPDEFVGAGLVVEQLDTKSEDGVEPVLATNENENTNSNANANEIVDAKPIIEENKPNNY